MGDPVNYAIVRGGARRLFWSGNGALSLPHDLQSGPAACEALIRERASDPEEPGCWLDSGAMEGGICLDFDAKRATFFGGGEDVNLLPALQRRLLERLRPAWSREGWELVWARRWAYDVVEAAGDPPELCEPPVDLYLWSERRDLRDIDPELIMTVIGRREGTPWDLRVTSEHALEVAAHGPVVLGVHADLPGLEAAPPANVPAFLFDEAARTITLVSPLLLAHPSVPLGLRTFTAERFPGWEVAVDLDASSVAERLRTRYGASLAAPDCGALLSDEEADAHVEAVLSMTLFQG